MTRRRSSRSPGESGAALVVVIFASTVILALLMTALIITRMSGRAVARQLTYQGQALNAASAGLTEGQSWFIRQPSQPVVTFDPKLAESEDPASGIVRSYEIFAPGRVWGRYEVRRSAVTDVSTRRGKPQAGTVWRMSSVGIVYVRNDPSRGPGQGPNQVLARRTMAGEIQRLAVNPPAPAALNASRGTNVLVTRSGRIQGGASGIGIAYPPSTGTPTNTGTVTGNPAQNTTTNPFGLSAVFGVSQQELVSMADIVVDNEQQLPDPLPNMALIVIRNNATFTPQRRLTGSGILIVLGNLILNPQSNAMYSGVIWVGGTLNVSPPTSINGSVIANSTANFTAAADVSELNYDPAILNQIRMQLGNYHSSRSPWVVGVN